jgi:hypothetical protein
MHRLQIKHITTYQYAETVTLLPHKLLLRPREGHDIRIEAAELTITPSHQLQWQRMSTTTPWHWQALPSRVQNFRVMLQSE